MTRARAFAAAVPQRVYTAVAGLVLLASLGVVVLLGAGLSTWQGAVRDAPARDAGRTPSVVSPPRSAVIVVPTPRAPAPHRPGVSQPTGSTGGHGVVTVTVPAAAVVVAGPVPAPAGGSTAATPSTVATPRVSAPAPASTPAKHANAGHPGNRGKHLGWTKGVRGADHAHGPSRSHR